MRFVAVFDTNILFSAVGWKGKPFECLEMARSGTVEGVTCRELLEELAAKLEAKLSFTTEQVVEVLADHMTFLRVVSIPSVLKVVAADPDDDKVLECAEVAAATHIVTGDRRAAASWPRTRAGSTRRAGCARSGAAHPKSCCIC